MAGHTAHEGPYLAPPHITTNKDFHAFLRFLFLGSKKPSVDYMLEELCPELDNNWNTDYLRRAFDSNSYNYEFPVHSGAHGTDFQYAFYHGLEQVEGGVYTGNFGPANVKLALIMQGYITNFVKTSQPNSKGLAHFPAARNEASKLGVEIDTIKIQPDKTANKRCAWHQKYPPV